MASEGSFTLGVELLDRRVVPGRDFAEIDLGERRAVEHEFARLDAFEVHDRNDAAHDRRELHKAVLLEFFARQRLVGSAERDGVGFDLLDAAARADRLIVQADARLFFVGVSPLRINGIRERRPGAGNVRLDGRGRRGCRRQRRKKRH